MKTSEALDQIATALAAAQAKMRPAVKDSNNPAFKSKYADLTSVWEACREALTANGISVAQDVSRPNGHVEVVTRLMHKSGQWLEFGPLSVPIDKQNAHGVGSATSYARRYGLSAAVGVVQDDDDGNAAANVETPPPAGLRKVPPAEPPKLAAPPPLPEALTKRAVEIKDALLNEKRPEGRKRILELNAKDIAEIDAVDTRYGDRLRDIANPNQKAA